MIGSLLLKSQGRAVWRRFSETMAAGRMPHREVLDGVMVIFGGAFLITPGFITDIVGLFLLLPPTRALARRLVIRALGGRVRIGVAGAAGTAPAAGAGYDVEGTATEVERRVRAAYAAAAAVSAAPAELAVALSFFDPDARPARDDPLGADAPLRGARGARRARRRPRSSGHGEGWQGRARRRRRRQAHAGVGHRGPRRRRGDRLLRRGHASAARRSRASGRRPRRARRRNGASSICCARSPPCSSRALAALAVARRPREAEEHGSELRHGGADRGRRAARARGRAHLDRLRRRRAPAQLGARALVPRRGLPAAAVRHRSGGNVARARGPVRARRGVHLADGGARRRRALRADTAARRRRSRRPRERRRAPSAP